MEKQEKAWYVGHRAEIMAQLLLQELGASVFTAARDENGGPFDCIASFLTDDEKSRIAAIEVKSTQQRVEKEFRFMAQAKSIRALQHSNVPVLFLVVDVKHNEVFYGWASDVRYDASQSKGKQTVRCTLPVLPAEGKKGQLLNAILSQPGPSASAGRS